MKKISNFFMKHKLATIIFAVVLVAAVSLTAVTIALWNTSEDEEIIYTIPENPAEKYLEYYAMTPNAASKSGYDYYPLSRIPSELIDKVEGVAVARYDGFATEVEIPSYVNVNGKDQPVRHILRNYSTLVTNGFVSSTVEDVILPPTVTYVEDGALKGLNVYVKGDFSYTFKAKAVSNATITVTDGSGNIIDTLVKKGEFYYSTNTYDKFVISNGSIVYKSSYSSVKFDGFGLELDTTVPVSRIYLEDNNGTVTYQNETLRKNEVKYTLKDKDLDTVVDDLFGYSTGYMISTGGNNYYRYIVVSGATDIYVGSTKVQVSEAGKYLVEYNNTTNTPTLTAEKVNYYIGSKDVANLLKLDLNCNDYERYYSSSQHNFTGDVNVVRDIDDVTHTLSLGSRSGDYILSFTPDVVYTDGDDVTNYSLTTNNYFLLELNTSTTSYEVTVDSGSGVNKVFTATGYADGVINGDTESYNLSFILPNSDCTYYALLDNQLVELVNVGNKYLANSETNGSVRILGYKNENKVYESVLFDYVTGYEYDLTTTSGYKVESKDLDTTNNEFKIVLDSSIETPGVVTITANYYDSFNDNKLTTGVLTFNNLTLNNNTILVSSSDFLAATVTTGDESTKNILKDATVLTNEYVFASYEIKIDGFVVYSYSESNPLIALNFYQKQYNVGYVASSSISSGNVYFDYSALSLADSVINVTSNKLSLVKTSFSSSVAAAMQRNYANTFEEEYYAVAAKDGYFGVSTSNNIEHLISSSVVNVKAGSVIYFANDGYEENKYSIYSLDGGFVTDMVYESGSAYASLPTFYTPYGYYVVDKDGNLVTTYESTDGYFNELYDNYLYDSTNNDLTAIPMLKDGSSYVAKNVLLAAGTYHVSDTVNVVIASEGYYDVVYDGNTTLTATASSQLEGNYSLKIGDVVYNLYPTNNPNIYVTYVYDAASSTEVKLYAGESIMTTCVLNTGGSYKVYVNVSNYIVDSNKGWVNNFFNFVSINNNAVRTFKLVESNVEKQLTIVNKAIASESTVYKVTSKVSSDNVYANGILLGMLEDDYWQGLINASGTLKLTHGNKTLTVNNLVSGTYRLFYDGNTLEYERVEGPKQYSISFSSDGTNYSDYYDMILNIDTTNYEEYILLNHSLGSNITHVKVKDELGNETVHTVSLTAGLNTIYFAIDNQRRKEGNNYGYLVNIKGEVNNSAIKVVLTSGASSTDYYLVSGNKLPSYEEVYDLELNQTFVGWYTDGEFTTLYNGLGVTAAATYYAKVLDGTKYIYASQSNLYTITDTNDTPVSEFEYNANTTYTFKVNVVQGQTISAVKVGSLVVTNNEGQYSFTTTNAAADLPLSIDVVLQNQMVTVTLIEGESSSNTSYEVGTYATFTPTNSSNFMYYYDTTTGIVYTDNTGRLISPYMIDRNITLTAAYSDNYTVMVNKILPNGTIEAVNPVQSYQSNEVVTNTFPRPDGYHYSKIEAYMTTNGYPVEYEINEYLHTYSFTMPNANVIINITYVNNVVDETPSASGTTDSIYVLVPTVMANEVKVYDSISKDYIATTRLSDSQQIYKGYVAYRAELDTAVGEFMVSANGEKSYVYSIDRTNGYDLYIIDNLSLENEVCYPAKWISYTRNVNTYTLDGTFESVHAIHGEISVDGNNVTIVKAISVDTYSYYQYASFEVTYNYNGVYVSFIVTYIADGSYAVESENADTGVVTLKATSSPIIIDSGDTFKEYIGNRKFRYSSGKCFIQTKDITVEDANGYEVVYDQTKPFNHTYIGNNKKIKYIQNEIRDNVNNGLFGYIGASGLLQNFELTYELLDQNSAFAYETKYYLGSIASVNSGKIATVQTADYTINGKNIRYVGGFVAINVGTIIYSTNNIDIVLSNSGSAESRILGGFAGYNGGLIKFSKNNAYVAIEGQTSREQYVGGLTGMNRGTLTSNDDAGVSWLVDTKASSTYSLEVTYPDISGNVTVTVPLYANAQNSAEVMTTSLYLPAGTTAVILKDGIPEDDVTAKDGNVAGTSISSNELSISTTGTYDLYYDVDTNKLYVGSGASSTQQLKSNTIDVVAVDDWYFIDEVKNTSHGTYYFESAMLVEYFKYENSEYKSLGTMVYNNAQTYDYCGMNTVVVDLLNETTHIEVSRLMLISSRMSGGEMFYYSYDGTKFTKIGKEFTSYPDKTYTTGKISVTSVEELFIYATASGERYATKTSGSNKVQYVTTNKDVVSYVDVTYSTEFSLANYRVKYYNGDTLVAIRSYVEGEQLQFLEDITKMSIESMEEGTGTRKICDVIPDTSKEVIQLSPIIYSSTSGNPSDYSISVDGKEQSMFINSANNEEVMVTSLELAANQTVSFKKNDAAVTIKTFDSYSTSNVSYADSVVTANVGGIYDIYYNTVTGVLYVGDGIVYEVVVTDSSSNSTAYMMYPNPSPINPNEVMAVGIQVDSTSTVKIRRYGDKNYLTDFNLYLSENNLASASNGVITFPNNDSYEFFLYVNDLGINLYVSSCSVDNYLYTYSDVANLTTQSVSAEGLPVVHFKNSISKYNDVDDDSVIDYTTRVYYLDSAGNYLKTGDSVYVFDFSTAECDIPIIDGAKMLKIVRYQDDSAYVEINEVIVNAVYENKTITLSMPYYGYYDASYASDVTDQQGLYLDIEADSAYIEYVLNDGRIGTIKMTNNQGKFYVPFDSIIGLNPKSLKFYYYTGESKEVINLDIPLFNISGNTIYYYENSLFTSKEYTTYSLVYLYVDERLCQWNEYYVLVDGNYNLVTKAGTSVIDGVTYVRYVAYVHGESFQLASTPNDNRAVFTTGVYENPEFIIKLILTEVDNETKVTGFSINNGEDVETYNYVYYLESETAGLLDQFGLVLNNGVYFGFHDVAEEVTYYVNNAGVKSNVITSSEGSHQFIYNGTTLSAYRNEINFTMTFMYNGNKERVNYAYGEIVTHAQVSTTPTEKYEFTFKGWNYNGITYLVDTNDNNKLYYENADGAKVYLYAVNNMTLTPVYDLGIKKFTITLINGTQELTSEYDYGQKISSSDFPATELTVPETGAWFAGWYLDSEMKVALENYPVIEDTTIYAKWFVPGVFLVGTIEGYTAWDDQRVGYLASDAADNDNTNIYILENIYLEKDDYVKLRWFLDSDSDEWLVWENTSKFSYNNGNPGELYDICYAEYADSNLWIQKTGYYSFYVRKAEDAAGHNKVDVNFNEYSVFYSYVKDELVKDTVYTFPNYLFTIEENETFELYSEEDKRIGESSSVNTPSLQKVGDDNKVYVVKGWYTRPMNGERVTSITTDMLTYRNSITLYPNYILGGYYLVDEDGNETIIGESKASNLNSLPKYAAGAQITIYYYNGSVHTSNGVSPLPVDDGEVIICGDATFTGNTVNITQKGYYDIYVDSNGKLHIDQYHEITYRFANRFTPMVNGTTKVASGVIYLQKYNDSLATVNPTTIANNSGVSVNFYGWTKEGYTDMPTSSNQKVTGNQTYDAVIIINKFNG